MDDIIKAMGRDQSHQTTRENTEMPARWRRGDVAIAVVACLLATSSSRAFGNAWEEEQGGCAVNYDGPAGTCRDERGGGKTAARAAGAGRGERKGLGQATAPGASRTAAVSCVTEPNVDYPGDAVNGDLDLQTNVASAAACCDLCKATKRCRFWTFSTPERGTQPYYCWLKNKRVRPHRRAGAVGLVSGFLTKGNLGIESEAASAEASPTRTSHAPSPGAAATSKDAGDAKVAASEEKKGKRRQKAKKMLEAAQKLYHAGKSGEAEPLLRKALKKDDMNGQVRMWLGFLLEQTGRWKDALSTYEAALAPGRIDFLSNNELAMVHNNLGLIYYKKQGRHDLAETQFRQSCDASEKAGMTAWTHSYKNLARLLEKDGRAREAMPFLDIVAQRTNNDALAFYSALLLPYVYQDAADIDEWRKQFKKNLASLAKRGLVMNDPFLMEGVPQYYLSYHGRNDASINSAIARVFRMACQTCVFRAPHTLDHKPKAAGAKVRVGFVSYYFREHSVSKMSLGLFKALDQESFYTVLFQFGFKDKTTDRLAEHMSKFHHSETWTLAQAQQMIAAEELDVLVFAEIGMDPHAYALAFGRYAPIQIAMHGHAQTSGISSLDYYVSYEGFSEPQVCVVGCFCAPRPLSFLPDLRSLPISCHRPRRTIPSSCLLWTATRRCRAGTTWYPSTCRRTYPRRKAVLHSGPVSRFHPKPRSTHVCRLSSRWTRGWTKSRPKSSEGIRVLSLCSKSCP